MFHNVDLVTCIKQWLLICEITTESVENRVRSTVARRNILNHVQNELYSILYGYTHKLFSIYIYMPYRPSYNLPSKYSELK